MLDTKLYYLLLLLGLAGCAPKKIVNGPSVWIEPRCITQPVKMDNCNLHSDPPKCSGPARVIYKRGCETIVLSK